MKCLKCVLSSSLTLRKRGDGKDIRRGGTASVEVKKGNGIRQTDPDSCEVFLQTQEMKTLRDIE